MNKIRLRPTANILPEYIDADGYCYLDLSSNDTTTFYTKVLEELTNANQLKTEYIVSYEVPITPKNTQLLQDRIHPNSTISAKIDYIEIVDNFAVFTDLSCIIIGYSKAIQLQFTLNNSHWVVKTSQAKLKDLDLGNITFTQAALDLFIKGDTDGFTGDFNKGYCIPLALYGDDKFKSYLTRQSQPQDRYVSLFGSFFIGTLASPFSFLSTNIVQSTPNMRPWFYVPYLIKKIIGTCGYNIQSNFLDSAIAKRCIVYLFNKEYGKETENASKLDVMLKVTDPTLPFLMASVNAKKLLFNSIIDNSGLIHKTSEGWGGVYSGRGEIKIRAYLLITSVFNIENMYLQVKRSNSSYHRDIIHQEGIRIDKNIDTEIEFELDGICLTELDTLEFAILQKKPQNWQLRAGSYIEITGVRKYIEPGETIALNKLVDQNLTQLDVIKAIASVFNLKFSTVNKDKQLQIEIPYKRTMHSEEYTGFFEQANLDFTEKAVESTSELEAINLDDVERYIIVKYADSNDQYIEDLKLEEPLYSQKIDLGKDFKKEEPKLLETSLFSATLNTSYKRDGYPSIPLIGFKFSRKDRILERSSYLATILMLEPNLSDERKYEDIERRGIIEDNYYIEFEIVPRILLTRGNTTHKLRAAQANQGSGQINFQYESVVYSNFTTASMNFNEHIQAMDNSYVKYSIAFGLNKELYYPEYINNKTNYLALNCFLQDILENYLQKKITNLFLLSLSEFLEFSFRNSYTIMLNGKPVICRAVEVSGFNSSLPTVPIKLLSIASAILDIKYMQNYLVGYKEPDEICKNIPVIAYTWSSPNLILSITGVLNDTIDHVEYFVAYPGTTDNEFTSTPSTFTPLHGLVNILATVYFDNCPFTSAITQIRLCALNIPIIEVTYRFDTNGNLFVKGTFNGDSISETYSVLMYKDLNDGSGYTSYTSGTEIENPEHDISFKAIVTYTNIYCDTQEIIEVFILDNIVANCEITNAGLNVVGNDTNKTLAITKIGDLAYGVIEDYVLYRFSLTGEWKRWDGKINLYSSTVYLKRVIIFKNNICPLYESSIYEFFGVSTPLMAPNNLIFVKDGYITNSQHWNIPTSEFKFTNAQHTPSLNANVKLIFKQLSYYGKTTATGLKSDEFYYDLTNNRITFAMPQTGSIHIEILNNNINTLIDDTF